MDLTEQRIIEIIDRNRDKIVAFAKDIEAHPEPGFEEERTAAKTAEIFRELNLEIKESLARTGVCGTLTHKTEVVHKANPLSETNPEQALHPSHNPIPHITIIGEMDAIGCRSHPMADMRTGVAHACGHHAQMAAMIGAAFALADEEVQKTLHGSVSFMAVPAEEYIDADKRKWLKNEGIEFPCGKSELIRTGAFDETDIALTTHVHMCPVEETLYLGNPSSNGFTAEKVTVRGKAAHAAIDPWNGVNALSITTSAISMMGLMRETFREEDHVRLHNVIRKAGDVVNSVPDEAVVETKVRASSLKRIREILNQVNRAYDGAAYAFGGNVEREILQGYMPVQYRPADAVLLDAAQELGVPYRTVAETDFNNACTDMGDLTHLLPVLNFTFNGFEGKLHGADFRITDEDTAYLLPAKMLALTTYKLLKNQAGEANKIIADFEPVFTKEEYTAYIKEHSHES